MKHKGSLSPILVLILLLALLVPSAFGPAPRASAQEPEPTPAIGPGGGGMPGYPRPAKPIPHHEPGQPSRAGSYRTQVVRENELGALEVVEISGLNAMAADGLDPLAGNYTMVSLDTILMSRHGNNLTSLQTFTSTLSPIGSQRDLGNFPSNDIAAGDLNGDGQAEQIAAWVDPADNHIYMSIGEMPGSLGRTTSAPAAVGHTSGSIDLLVRGYDDALWHRHSNNGQDWLPWQRVSGDLPLLSGPATASNRDGAFRVFAIGPDNQTWERDYNGSTWSDNWVPTAADTETWPALKAWRGPTPELPAPAAVAQGSRIDLFRLGPDNTLRWQHSDDGITWQAWQNLGGMISTGLGAVSQNDTHIQVYARGVDEALWHRTYNGADWDPWQRLERSTQMKEEEVTIASAPAVVSPTEIYACGSDNALWQFKDGSWHSLGGTLASGVAVAAGAWKFIAQADDGSLQYSTDGSDWPIRDGLMPCCMTYNTELSGQIKRLHPYKDFSVDIETGYFLGDGRSQIVVAYLSKSNPVTPTIALYQIGGGFIPQLVDQVQLGHNVDYFSITTGDFLDRDGIDEIAVGYVDDGVKTEFPAELGLDIVRFSNEALSVAKATNGYQYKDEDKCWDNENFMLFAGTLEVASGDLDADGQDELAMNSMLYCEDYQGAYNETFRFRARTRIFDFLDSAAGSYDIKTYYVEPGDGRERPRACFDRWSVSLALATGDVNGDGKDEIVRTWPDEYYCRQDYPGHYISHFDRQLQVLSLPNYDNWHADGNGEIDNPDIQNIKVEGSNTSYVDFLAVGDLDRDLREEIVWHIGTDADRILRAYNYVVPESGAPYFDPRDAHLPFVLYPNLVTGDFSREGLRVGPPVYRAQKQARQLLAVINTPPRHTDIINGQVIDVNSDTPETYASYENTEGQVTEVSFELNTAWGIAAGMDITAGDPEGTHVTASVNNTYGENFSEASSTYSENLAGLGYKVQHADLVQYAGTDYDIFEYPLYQDNSAVPASYITVVMPQVLWPGDPRGAVEKSFGSGYSCGYSYRPNHQLNNMLSYPTDPSFFTDYQEENLLKKLNSLSIGGLGFDDYFEWEEIKEASYSSATNLGVSAGVEAQVGGDKIPLIGVRVPWSVKVTVEGSYEKGTLSTNTVSGQKTTSIHVVMDPVANAHNYEVTPYMYWAEDGYLVVDYTTKPDASMSLWYDNYHLPDPAFILQWLDGSCTFGKEYSKDIVIEPPYAHAGDTVEITAKVRNFSLSPTSPFKVDFYQGDPDSGGVKIHREDEVSLGARGVESVSFEWEATGIGEQQIYAVIDPDNELVEVHDETDPNINNNKAFGRVVIGAARFMDPGPAAFRPYDALNLTGGPRNLDITAYVPLSSFEEVKLFELTHLEYGGSVAGDLFELAVYDEDGDKISNLSLQEMPHSPPTAIAIAYGDSTIIDEINNLKLYIFDERKALWNEVKCEPYEILRFPEDNLIIVPVCQTGIFALLEGAPSWLPVADFSANPTHGTAPLDVTFKDESTGYPDSWEWDFGDGAGSMEQHPSHTYTATGTYAVTLTVSNELGSDTMVDPDCVTVTEAGKKEMYLPLILKSAGPPGPGGPDLVVKELTASSNAITLVIKNQGDASVTDDFWVDAYVAPREPPRLNKIWQAIAEQGLAWGVTDPIAPGGELTLTIGGAYYVPGESEFSGMAPGTPVWAQVDAVNYQTSYGSVLEKNEANNLFGPVSAVASQAGVVAPPSVEGGEPVPVDEGLPGRR